MGAKLPTPPPVCSCCRGTGVIYRRHLFTPLEELTCGKCDGTGRPPKPMSPPPPRPFNPGPPPIQIIVEGQRARAGVVLSDADRKRLRAMIAAADKNARTHMPATAEQHRQDAALLRRILGE